MQVKFSWALILLHNETAVIVFQLSSLVLKQVFSIQPANNIRSIETITCWSSLLIKRQPSSLFLYLSSRQSVTTVIWTFLLSVSICNNYEVILSGIKITGMANINSFKAHRLHYIDLAFYNLQLHLKYCTLILFEPNVNGKIIVVT